MTDKYEDLRKAAQKATRGPWAVGKYLGQRSDEWSVFLRTPKGENGLPVVTTMFDLANATYIAAANPAAILELLATNERLVDEVAELKAAYESQFKELHALKAELERIKTLGPVAWCLGNPEFADSSNVFLANEFTPDGEHEDEWTALYALWSKT